MKRQLVTSMGSLSIVIAAVLLAPASAAEWHVFRTGGVSVSGQSRPGTRARGKPRNKWRRKTLIGLRLPFIPGGFCAGFRGGGCRRQQRGCDHNGKTSH